MKTVFPLKEIPHLWAHQTQKSARSSGNGTLYFEGDTIYSYGSHFPIARHITNKAGDKAILFTTRTYSSTTAKHLSYVRRAIPGTVRVFHVPEVMDAQLASHHQQNILDYKKRIEQLILGYQRGRRFARHNYEQAEVIREEAIAYCAFYKQRAKDLPTIPPMDMVRIAAIEEKVEAKEQVQREEQERRRIEREADEVRTWPEKMEAWRRGEYVYFGYSRSLPTLLRIKDNEIETSLGVRFPLHHAALALKVIRKVRETGESWKTNGHTIHLGHYTLDRIEADGTVHAGCHVVSFEEIERIAPEVEQLVGNVKDAAGMVEEAAE